MTKVQLKNELPFYTVTSACGLSLESPAGVRMQLHISEPDEQLPPAEIVLTPEQYAFANQPAHPAEKKENRLPDDGKTIAVKEPDGLNTYSKYCPNVFVAKCEKQHNKGDIIIITTKYGKEIENKVHNYLGQTKDGFSLYSVTRVDGINSQERARQKAEMLSGYAENAERRSMGYYKKADLSEAVTGIPLGQPILIGHHSESRHRKIIEKADNAMRKSIEEDQKAEDYRRRAEYWESRAERINLSMPESLEYYKYKVEESRKHHKDLKDHPGKREHGLALNYSNKAIKDAEANLKLAIKLWGTNAEIKAMYDEEKEAAEAKNFKNKSFEAKFKRLGGFFAFNADQFREGYAKIKETGHINDGEKVTHIKGGLYMPSKNVNAYLGK